ncbi:IclR family transcriptional regulator [Sphingomonas sp.]|uniref:IclR family transcriptional regulator n=1 Tax=Sphingomonas sp. TaxID=28214 RepID=UPI0031E2605B
MADESNKERRPYAAPALERGFEIFELFAAQPGELTITEIAQGLGRSISEVFRIVMVMERSGWLNKNADRYSVSFRMLDIAFRATPARTLTRLAAPVMERLATQTNQSSHLVVRSEGRGLVIHRQESAGPGVFAMRTGSLIDLVSSCSGHVLLAYESDTRRAAIIALLEAQSRDAAVQLEPRFAEVRARGYELQPSARLAGVQDISVPIFAFDGAIAAALTIPYLVRIDGSMATDLDQTRDCLIEAGREISALLGV